ncbi:19554_t:CDS:2, partial [Racocetra fulgida]
LFTLTLELILATLLCLVSLVEGKGFRIPDRGVTVKKVSTHENHAKKNIKSKKLQENSAIPEANDSAPTMTHLTSEPKPENIIITGTLSELKPDSETSFSSEPITRDIKVTEKVLKDDITTTIEEKKNLFRTNESDIVPIEVSKYDSTAHEMHFSPETNDFIAVVKVDRTKQHEFKFVVDGDWRHNENLPIRYDQ